MGTDTPRSSIRPQRTYRACYPCRSRKTKCSFGDPNQPWNGPCERCRREQRECVRGKPTFVRDCAPRKSDQSMDVDEPPAADIAPPGPSSAAPRSTQGGASSSVAFASEPLVHQVASRSPRRQGSAPVSASGAPGSSSAVASSSTPPAFVRASSLDLGSHVHHGDDHIGDVDQNGGEESSGEDEQAGSGGNTLVSSNLQNPSDALRLLASASSLRYRGVGQSQEEQQTRSAAELGLNWQGDNAATWSSWEPVEEGCVTVQEAQALFTFFELEIAPLYPLIHPMLFEPHYLSTLVHEESFLLATLVVIAARYSSLLVNNRGPIVHRKLSQWIRLRLMDVMDGDPALRCISTVEALLLMTEWPLAPKSDPARRASLEKSSEEARLLYPSLRYDAYSWTSIGLAVRLSQELGIHHAVLRTMNMPKPQGKQPWKEMRKLKTWVYCYTADRHIAVRLGRNAVFQEAMSSRWWEATSSFIHDDKNRHKEDVWTSDAWILGAIAQLMGTIQDHLYANKEMTRSLLRTGAWESFLRSLRLEIRYSKRATRNQLSDGSVGSALLQIEYDYVVLYAYSLALRALQDKLRRRRHADDIHYSAPSLLNLVEGPWIMEALSAARSILETALNVLQKRGMLRYCPSRIFQFILFATTFLYKALACGMVEHGQNTIAGMLQQIVSTLNKEAIDDEHFVKGFAELLQRLGKHWRSSSQMSSPSVLNVEPSLREENRNDTVNLSGVPRPSATSGTTAGGAEGSSGGSGLPTTATGLGTGPLGSGLTPFGFGLSSPLGGAGAAASLLPQHGSIAPSAGPSNRSPPGMFGDMGWNFNPTFQMPAADHEQDALFQTIWDNPLQDVDAETSNLYATLLGDAFNLPDGVQ